MDTRQQHDKYKEVRIKHRPSRPPIVAAGCTADNDISIVSVYVAGVPTLCDEITRWSPENQRGSSNAGWESPAGRSREASLIPKLRIKLRRNVTTGSAGPTRGAPARQWPSAVSLKKADPRARSAGLTRGSAEENARVMMTRDIQVTRGS